VRELTNLGAAVMDPLLALPSAPRITYYDDATGGRIELSTVTLANWAAKTGNLLRDELGAGPGSRVAVLLPMHWQTAGALLGIWWIGAEVVLNGDAADIGLCTAERLAEVEDLVGMGEIAVLSLDPFGKSVPDLPFGVTDYATAVRVHGDEISPERNPGPALDGHSADEVLATARSFAARWDLTPSDRVLSTTPWDNAGAVANHLVGVLSAGASLVLVANPDTAALTQRKQSENVTRDISSDIDGA
jgi:uncharacterized protein (TIGR03089 family)